MRRAIKELTVREPFKSLFAVEPDVVQALTVDMKANGFDAARTIFAWRSREGDLVVVDGHMRLEAAKAARLKEVHVTTRKFADEDAAFAFAIASQRNRRNLTKEQIATAIARAELARENGTGLLNRADSARFKTTGSVKGRWGGGAGTAKDPVRQAVVEKAAKAGVGERTARKGLANARAERKAPAAAKPKPVPTMPELREALKAHIAEARDLGPVLTAFGKGEADSLDLERSYYAAVGTLNTYGKKLTVFINDHEEEKSKA